MFAGAVAERTPVRALFALPRQWGTVNLGELDLYRTTPGALTSAQRRDALAAADAAALMMLNVRTDPSSGDLEGGGAWLDHSVSSNAKIHLATGMVLAQLGVSATEAPARMRGHAFAQQRLLAEVARDVVSRKLLFSENM